MFSVPPRTTTKRRADIINGNVVHIEPAEYHLDPLSPEGISAFWDIGPDLAQLFPTEGLNIRIARPVAADGGRVVWIAENVGNENNVKAHSIRARITRMAIHKTNKGARQRFLASRLLSRVQLMKQNVVRGDVHLD